MAKPPSHVEFYRRELPPPSVPFASEDGQARLLRALQHGTGRSFFRLIEQLRTQDDPAYCGLSTLVVVLNSLGVDPRRRWKGPWRWFNESMLDCCAPLEQVRQEGIPLDTFACLGRCNGLHADVIRPPPSEEEALKGELTEPQFRQYAREMSMQDETVLVTSYSRRSLHQTGSGHFSPIGAYDAETDSVLVLEVARFKYPPHWVPLHDLYEAMRAIDTSTGHPRGMVLFSRMAVAPLLLFELQAVACASKDGSGSPEGSEEKSCCQRRNHPRCGPAALRQAVQQVLERMHAAGASTGPDSIVRSFVGAYGQVMACCSEDELPKDGILGCRAATEGVVDKFGREHADAAEQMLEALRASVVHRQVRALAGSDATSAGDGTVGATAASALPSTQQWRDTAARVRVQRADLVAVLLLALALPRSLQVTRPTVRSTGHGATSACCGSSSSVTAARSDDTGAEVPVTELEEQFYLLEPWVCETFSDSEEKDAEDDREVPAGRRLLLNEVRMLHRQLAELITVPGDASDDRTGRENIGN